MKINQLLENIFNVTSNPVVSEVHKFLRIPESVISSMTSDKLSAMSNSMVIVREKCRDETIKLSEKIRDAYEAFYPDEIKRLHQLDDVKNESDVYYIYMVDDSGRSVHMEINVDGKAFEDSRIRKLVRTLKLYRTLASQLMDKLNNVNQHYKRRVQKDRNNETARRRRQKSKVKESIFSDDVISRPSLKDILYYDTKNIESVSTADLEDARYKIKDALNDVKKELKTLTNDLTIKFYDEYPHEIISPPNASHRAKLLDKVDRGHAVEVFTPNISDFTAWSYILLTGDAMNDSEIRKKISRYRMLSSMREKLESSSNTLRMNVLWRKKKK